MSPVCLRRFALLSALLLLVLSRGISRGGDGQLEALEEQAFREAAALAAPSIVRIETVGGRELVSDVLTPTGPTTGVIVSADGDVMTSSFNFASEPSSVIVTTPDGQRHPARIVASDEARMLTLLKIDAAHLVPLEPAPRSELRVGQWAIALGRTYDSESPGISVGLVSAANRIWGRALQTDANVSPTNYGGPLVDIQGRGLGLIVPLSPQEEGVTAGVEWYDSGIGFAIPLADVYAAAERLNSGMDLRPGKLGVIFTERGPLAGEPVIDRVRPGSPAFDAGLQQGDRIIEVDHTAVERLPQLRSILGRKYAGDPLVLLYRRGDEQGTAELTLTDELNAFEFPMLGILPGRPSALAPAENGVSVRAVLSDTPAAQVDIKAGDRIVRMDRTDVTTATQLRELVSRQKTGDSVELELLRGETPVQIAVTLAPLSGAVPDELPSLSIPAPQAPIKSITTGRQSESLGEGSDRRFWSYVPTGYNPDYTYGLVVWIHPSADSMEAAILHRWQALCERRGLILVGPLADDVAGWTPNDAGFVADVVKQIQQKFSVDPRRIVVHAFGDGAELGCLVAFRERDLVRGVSLIGAPVNAPPPENHPDYPLQFHFALREDDPLRESIEDSADALEKLRFPTVRRRFAGERTEYPDVELIDEIAMWIDRLDVI